MISPVAAGMAAMKQAESGFASHRRMLLFSLCCCAAGGWRMAWAQSAFAGQDVVRRYEGGRFRVEYRYGYEILDDALQHSVTRYGPYKIEPVATEMSENRLRQEVLKGDLVNVMVHNADYRDLNEELTAIDIPLEKGLQGYRVGLIRATDQGRINQVRDIGSFRQLQIGAGEQWSDVKVYRENGILPVTAKSYESLMQMLEHGRFDLFPRAATGILAEYDNFKGKYPSLGIDQHLLLYWPSAKYIYVSKSAPRLAERIRYGLEEMQKDGSFDRRFEEYASQVIAELDFPHRTVIELENPLLPSWARVPRLEWR